MYQRISVVLVILIFSVQCFAQTEKKIIQNDSSLKEVIVTAFNANVKWKEAPASIAIISSKELAYYAPTSFVPMINNIPGVRMEERSPGSYRLSVRGSLLRSPFGVRNVKVYWNEIPLSDATGNSYVNLLDLQSIDQIEIAKGPSSSSYGAGTGGVFLFKRSLSFTDTIQHRFNVSSTFGSFGLNQQQVDWVASNKKFSSSLQVNHLQSDGYRQQSALAKSSIVWQTVIKTSKGSFNTILFYTDLNYGTPGGITLAQMQNNPQLARQKAGVFPGALEQKTTVFNKTLLAGAQYQHQFNEQSMLKSFVSISKTNFENPFITNYEQRFETNINIGMQHAYTLFKSNQQIQWISGFELLLNESRIDNYINKGGVKSDITSKDFIYSRQGFLFSQIKMSITPTLIITSGFSINNQLYDYKRLSNSQTNFTTRKINAPFVPRVAISYQFNNNINLYGIVAQGFSSPSLAEVRPSDGNFYPFLEAEKGLNIEAGIKGTLFNQKLIVDFALYSFRLNNAIVRRNDAAGAEYFVNAGSTIQQGVELLLKYTIVNNKMNFIKQIQLNGSFSYQPYKFIDYKQGSIDYSNNELTGVPRTISVMGLFAKTKNGIYLNTSLNATEKIPLNDGNTVFADAYQLLQIKLGKEMNWKQHQFDVFIGGDNLLNQLYSLGNDINAAGARYYNPAPIRNWYGGIRFAFH